MVAGLGTQLCGRVPAGRVQGPVPCSLGNGSTKDLRGELCVVQHCSQSLSCAINLDASNRDMDKKKFGMCTLILCTAIKKNEVSQVCGTGL